MNKNVLKNLFSTEKLPETIFWIAAIVLLFLNLGKADLAGSESRWAGVVREMFSSGNFLQPTVNFEPYFDKPLGSYWMIAFFTLFNHNTVNELLIRIPSAIAGLATLWATRSIAGIYGDKRIVIAAGWLMLTIYSFAFWGRLGEADMLNAAFSTIAVAWYLRQRENAGFGSYLLFGALCAIGGQTKGLSAIAVPVLAVFVDVILRKDWKKHLNWQLVAAGILSAMIYFVPFICAMYKSGDYSSNGLALVFRENIVRYFQAFDHEEGWYAYFIHVAQLFLPWTPFLIFALIWTVKEWQKEDLNVRWLLLSIGAIFLIFSLSDSKRIYYILPILPYCAVATARYLCTENLSGIQRKIRDILFKIYGNIMLPASILLLIAGVAAIFTVQLFTQNIEMQSEIRNIAQITILPSLMILVLALQYRKNTNHYWYAGVNREFGLATLSFLIIMITVFCVIRPYADAHFRTEKQYFAEIAELFRKENVKTNQIYFFYKRFRAAIFYFNRPEKIEVIVIDPTQKKMLEEPLVKFLQNRSTTEKSYLISQDRYFNRIQDPFIRKELATGRTVDEPEFSWENRETKREKFRMIILPPRKP